MYLPDECLPSCLLKDLGSVIYEQYQFDVAIIGQTVSTRMKRLVFDCWGHILKRNRRGNPLKIL